MGDVLWVVNVVSRVQPDEGCCQGPDSEGPVGEGSDWIKVIRWREGRLVVDRRGTGEGDDPGGGGEQDEGKRLQISPGRVIDDRRDRGQKSK